MFLNTYTDNLQEPLKIVQQNNEINKVQRTILIFQVDNCLRVCSRRYRGADLTTSNSDFDSIKNGMSTCNSGDLKCKEIDLAVAEDTSSLSCLLLKRPQELSSEEEFVLAFYETYKYCKNAFPVIRLAN